MSNQRAPREDYYGSWHLPLNRAQQRNRDEIARNDEQIISLKTRVYDTEIDIRKLEKEVRELRSRGPSLPRYHDILKRVIKNLWDGVKADSNRIKENSNRVKANSNRIKKNSNYIAEDDHFSYFLIDFLSKKFPEFEEEMHEHMYHYHKKKEEEEEAKDGAKALLSMNRSVGTKRRRREREKSKLKF